eukprot:7232356-Pyramimonas_sp.AAC.1
MFYTKTVPPSVLIAICTYGPQNLTGEHGKTRYRCERYRLSKRMFKSLRKFVQPTQSSHIVRWGRVGQLAPAVNRQPGLRSAGPSSRPLRGQGQR